jgi:hypothetical protein
VASAASTPRRLANSFRIWLRIEFSGAAGNRTRRIKRRELRKYWI